MARQRGDRSNSSCRRSAIVSLFPSIAVKRLSKTWMWLRLGPVSTPVRARVSLYMRTRTRRCARTQT